MRPLKWLVVAINVAAGLLMLAIGGVAWFLSSERAAAWLVETAVARTDTYKKNMQKQHEK